MLIKASVITTGAFIFTFAKFTSCIMKNEHNFKGDRVMKKYIGMAMLVIAGLIAHAQPEFLNISITELIRLFA